MATTDGSCFEVNQVSEISALVSLPLPDTIFANNANTC